MSAAMQSLETREFARVEYLMKADPSMIFVFGSNQEGVHGAGAAKAAQQWWGAKRGHGEGVRGRSYAIPTKATWRRALSIDAVAEHVEKFLSYARSRPDVGFAVTRIGCGFAGFTDEQIAPLFAAAPSNCYLPEGWRP